MPLSVSEAVNVVMYLVLATYLHYLHMTLNIPLFMD